MNFEQAKDQIAEILVKHAGDCLKVNGLDSRPFIYAMKEYAKLYADSVARDAWEALEGIARTCDNQNPTHEIIWRIADEALKNKPEYQPKL